MAETTADVRRDIELTRERMSGTIQELEQKLNITQMVRDHPWPALALAVGAGVLLSGSPYFWYLPNLRELDGYLTLWQERIAGIGDDLPVNEILPRGVPLAENGIYLTIGGRTAFICTCAGGVRTYHTRLEGPDRIVSLQALGEGRYGERILAGLTE